MLDNRTSRPDGLEDQIRARSIVNERVLNALRCVPRHCFVPANTRIWPTTIARCPSATARPFTALHGCLHDRIPRAGAGRAHPRARHGLRLPDCDPASLGRTVTVERDPDLPPRARLGGWATRTSSLSAATGPRRPAHAPGRDYGHRGGLAARALIEQLADGGRLPAPPVADTSACTV